MHLRNIVNKRWIVILLLFCILHSNDGHILINKPSKVKSDSEVSNASTATQSSFSSSSSSDHHLSKRQIPYVYDFGFMDYAAYDYYDWVCAEGKCQICNVLTGACCNPLLHENCFIPDFCSNTPCLYNGKCAGTLTLDGHLDFVCICIRGHTGKYCQLVDDFTPIDVEYRPPNAVPNVIG